MQAYDWQAIVKEYGPLVWQTAYRLLANHTDTADCFQETFLAALAAVFILLGYTAGRLSAPKPMSLGQLREALIPSVAAAIKPAIRESVVKDTRRDYQLALAATYDRIVEDLSIMSRIIEKNLREASEQGYGLTVTGDGMYGGVAGIYGQPLFLPFDSTGPGILRSSSGRPKAIYIGGYGVVFSLQVSFPLVPPPETPELDKTDEKADQVWAAAPRELADPHAVLRAQPGTPQGKPYRAEAVENLRSTLTELLRHATNMRNLEPDAWLTILVQGPDSTAQNQTQNSPYGQDLVLPNPSEPQEKTSTPTGATRR